MYRTYGNCYDLDEFRIEFDRIFNIDFYPINEAELLTAKKEYKKYFA